MDSLLAILFGSARLWAANPRGEWGKTNPRSFACALPNKTASYAGYIMNRSQTTSALSSSGERNGKKGLTNCWG